MVQIFDPLDPAGEVGRSFGKGFGGQVNREVQATRMGDELDALRDSFAGKDKQIDPFALTSVLTKIGSRLPAEQGAAFYKSLPALQQELMRTRDYSPFGGDDLREPGVGAGASTGYGQGDPSTQRQPVSQELSDDDQTLISLRDAGFPNFDTLQDPDALKALGERDFVFNPREFRQRSNRLMTDLGIDRPTAEARVREEESRINSQKNARVNQAIAQKGIENEYYTELDKELTRLLQPGEGGLATVLPGEIQANLREAGLALMKSDPSLSPQQAAKEIGRRALEFKRSKDAFDGRNELSGNSLILASLGSIESFQKNMVKYRKAYENVGALDQFQDDLVAKNFTPEYAAYYARPMTEDLAKGISGVPKLSKAARDAKMELPDKVRSKAMDSVASALESFDSDNDSLLSIKVELDRMGYPEDILEDAVLKVQESKPFLFGDRAARELPLLSQPMEGDLSNIFLRYFGAPSEHGRTLKEDIGRSRSGGRMRS